MGLAVSGWGQPAHAAAGGPPPGAPAGRLRSSPGRHAPPAGFSAQLGRKPACLGRTAPGSVSSRIARREPAADRHRWLPRAGSGYRDRLSAGPASALLGAQDAQHSEQSASSRPRCGQSRRPGHLPCRQSSASRSRVSRLPPPLAIRLWLHGATTGTRSAAATVVLQLPSTAVEKAAHHQHHRTLLRRSAAAHPPHGLLCERAKRGPDYLLHLPALQPGMEKPHPQGFYTSSLTSPLQYTLMLG